MKLNRKWLLVIALVVSMATAISGTLAYLTDKDEATNVFTMGQVDIELEEVFTNNVTIYPGVTINKDAKIKNSGEKEAWVWMTVSVPKEIKDYVTPNWTEAYANQAIGPKVDGDNAVWTVLVKDALAKDEGTGYILDSVTLSTKIDYQKINATDENPSYVVMENGKKTKLEGLTEDNKLNVTVTAYAVQTSDELTSITAAYNAYNGQWGNGIADVPVASVTELTREDTIVNTKGKTVLGSNLTISTSDKGMVEKDSVSLNVAYQFKPSETSEEIDVSPYKLWHADYVVSADKDVPAKGIVLAGHYSILNDEKWIALYENNEIKAGDEIRLLKSMFGEDTTFNYDNVDTWMNDDIGFLCGAVKGKVLGLTAEDVSGITMTVELRLYEIKEDADSTSSTDCETGNYITIGTYTYTF